MHERNASQAQWVALHGGQPLVVFLYEHREQRDALLAQLPLFLDEGVAHAKTKSVEDLISKPDTALFFCPDDEPGALRALVGQREMLLDRTQPAVLFLLRGGTAHRLLADAQMAGLSSWLQGSIIDVHTLESIDESAGTKDFAELTGQSPAEWLRDWHRGALPDTLDNQLLYHRAVLLSPS